MNEERAGGSFRVKNGAEKLVMSPHLAFSRPPLFTTLLYASIPESPPSFVREDALPIEPRVLARESGVGVSSWNDVIGAPSWFLLLDCSLSSSSVSEFASDSLATVQESVNMIGKKNASVCSLPLWKKRWIRRRGRSGVPKGKLGYGALVPGV